MPGGASENLANEGVELVRAGDIQSAIRKFAEALQYDPCSTSALHNLANALLMTGSTEEGLAAAICANRSDPSLAATQSNLLQATLYSMSLTPEGVAEAHLDWGSRYQSVARPGSHSHHRLRVGYLSSYLCCNPEFFYLEPVFRNHDRTRFEVFCYGSVETPDEFTDRLRQVSEHWRDIFDLSDDEVARYIRDDEIDILVESSGHFGGSRIRVLALRPAPIQASYPTYPATTGLTMVDYRVTDAVADPPGATEHLHTEKLIRLPHTFVCYRPLETSPTPGELPVSRNGFITFGSFSRFHKLNAKVIDAWAAVLRQLPNSVLLFHHAFHGGPDVPYEYCEPILRSFLARGVSPDRLQFAGNRSVSDHLELFRAIDILLDPFPYAGMTITCDSLWMGVPVVTLAGRSHISRTCLSLLSSVGLSDWSASSQDEYVSLAVRKAQDIAGLERCRQSLRQAFQHSPIADEVGYTRDLEAAYTEMVARYRAECGRG